MWANGVRPLPSRCPSSRSRTLLLAGQTVPNSAVLGLGAASSIDIYNFDGTTDMRGFFSPIILLNTPSSHAWGSTEGSVQLRNFPGVNT